MVARYYTSVACLDMQADNLMVLVTYGLSSAPSCLLSYTPFQKRHSKWQIVKIKKNCKKGKQKPSVGVVLRAPFSQRVLVYVQRGTLADGAWCDNRLDCWSLYPNKI
jgi:hypothetical protein